MSNESSCDDDEVNDRSIGGKAYTRNGKQLLYNALTESVEEEALNKLFMRMHADEIKDIAMRDVLIRRVGYLRIGRSWKWNCPKTNWSLSCQLVYKESFPPCETGHVKTNQLCHSGLSWAKTPLMFSSNQQRQCLLKKNRLLPLSES